MKKIYCILILFLICGCIKLPENTNKNIEDALIEKAQRIGLYLTAAKQAEEEGNSQASVYLCELAEEEIEHIKNLSIIQARPGRSAQSSIKKIMQIEKNAARSKYPKMARNAHDEDKEEVADLFKKMAQDEERHYSGLRGIRKKN